MIERFDEQLLGWARGIVQDAEVTLLPPHLAQQGGSGISLYLFDLVRARGIQRAEAGAIRLVLRYLVTSWAEQPDKAHALLAELAFAALDHPEFEVEFSTPAQECWRGLGILPQPCFVLQVLLSRERPITQAKAIKQPIVIQTTPTSSLFGRVLTPEQVPLVGMRVELAALNRSTTTDVSGRFHFSSIPVGSSRQHLRIIGRGAS
jgi:hypothetical protein